MWKTMSVGVQDNPTAADLEKLAAEVNGSLRTGWKFDKVSGNGTSVTLIRDTRLRTRLRQGVSLRWSKIKAGIRTTKELQGWEKEMLGI